MLMDERIDVRSSGVGSAGLGRLSDGRREVAPWSDSRYHK
jgi:hypothetical protein